MKKLISLILISLLALSLAACRESQMAGNDPTAAPTQSASAERQTAVPTEAPAKAETAAPTERPNETMRPLGTPMPTSPGEEPEGFPKVILGRENGFIVKGDGSLWGWGKNSGGQIGDGTRNDRSSPVYIANGLTPISVGETVLALAEDGSLWGWGENGRAQLGLGDTDDRLLPAKLMDNVTNAFEYDNRTYALTGDGGLYVWGCDNPDSLTPDERGERMKPRLLLNGVRYVEDGHAVTEDGDLYQLVFGQAHKLISGVSRFWFTEGGAVIWERPDGGLRCEELSDGIVNEIAIGENVLSVTTVYGTAWILTTDGALYRYVVETESAPYWIDPAEVHKLRFFMDGVTEFVGDAHSDIYMGENAENWNYDVELALKADGELWAWSYMSSTATGIAYMGENGKPYLVAHNVKTIFRNGPMTYLITNDGEVPASGAGEDKGISGSLGTGDGMSHIAFTALGLTGIRSVSGVCFIKYNYSNSSLTKLYTRVYAAAGDGTVYAWGWNGDGFLGAGEGKIVSVPETVITAE